MKLTKRIYTPCNYTITNDISVIEVDTSAGGVANIYLQPINFNFKFDTVFINDISDNASVGNIILHTTGIDLINSSSFLVLDTDGITAELLVANKNEYLANLSTDGESSGASGPAGGDLSGLYPNPNVLFPNGYITYDLRYIQIGAGTGGDLLGSLPSPTVNWANGYSTYDLQYIQIGATAGGDLSGTFPSPTINWTNGYATYDARYIKTTEKGIANGVVPLNGATTIDATYLPSYVDDVIEVPNYASLPLVGETGKIYITLDTNNQYRWTGSVYVQITNSSAVWGNISGIIANQLDLVSYVNTQISTSLTGYAKLDASNQPFTGNIKIDKANPQIDFASTLHSANMQFYYNSEFRYAIIDGNLNNGFEINCTPDNYFRVGVSASAYTYLGSKYIHFTGHDSITKAIFDFDALYNGTTLTLVGNTSNNLSKALSVKDSSNVEYFYLRNDKTALLTGSLKITSSAGTAETLRTETTAGTNNMFFTATGNIVHDYTTANAVYWRAWSDSVGGTQYFEIQSSPSVTIIQTVGVRELRVGRLGAGGTWGNTTFYRNSDIAHTAPSMAFADTSFNIRTTLTTSTGNWNYTGSAQNMLTVANGIKIGDNTDSAVTAGAGSIKYISSTLQFSDGANWNSLATHSSLTTNFIPKWDGANLVDSYQSDVTITDPTLGSYLGTKNTSNSMVDIAGSAGGGFRLFDGTSLMFAINHFSNAIQLFTFGARRIRIGSYNSLQNIEFISSNTTLATFNGTTGNWNYTGTAQNMLTVANGIKIGNNTDTFGVAGVGSIKYASDLFYGATSTAWRTFAFDGFENNITTTASAGYTILSTDYIVNFTATGSHTLPSIASVGIGKVYRLFAKNVPTTINIAGGSGNTIDGVASANMVGYAMITLRAIATNEWRIGD